MDYKALYRKFRPKVFEAVIGQGHVTETLKNQIVTDNIGHAYLFSGIRGTGKTSTAKIFARALNCTNSNDGNPCNECENCLSALSDNAIDIIEIDAASNNGVDDIRDLREKTKYPPSKMKYKVYIIDEVHMLSIGAFNALLKTLEEPPSYVVFIFATTEIHKIPATIISRCQKYELKRIKQNDISDLMKGICEESGYTYDDVALDQIARLADGAARDSLSILEQCFAANAEKHISLDVLTDVLGLVTDDTIFAIVEAIHHQDGKDLLTHLNDVVIGGKDLKRFTNQLIDYMRSLMLAKISSDLSNMINASDDAIERIKEQSAYVSLDLLLRSINILTQVEVDSKWSSNARVILEIGLIKMIQPDLETSIEALTQRVDQLERRPAPRMVSQPAQAPVKQAPVQQIVQEPVEQAPKAVQQEQAPQPVPQMETPVDQVPDTPYEDAASISHDDSEDLWEDVLAFVKNERVSTQVLLSDGHFEGIIDNAVTISYGEGYGFHLIAVEKPENKELVERAIYQIYGQKLRVKYITKNQEEENSQESLETDEEKLYNFLGEHKNKLEFED
ncbi:DNA polymerase III subunit gamma/tau [Acidaminobacter sp. JC074]|uniref:DNA polymerase III subunit gamma/tau n=1 Tax=Acidaminobacter sp. JC074 TaxID=2530199 RepID=UPI001F0E0F26|nr:DNA polymerase III subunit gamma/tau [Acidaminobacter sp. JC074]MCH4891085.1 DNA polymerase III subunit gamma/tau [Acidaminobacter sp. JC074]